MTNSTGDLLGKGLAPNAGAYNQPFTAAQQAQQAAQTAKDQQPGTGPYITPAPPRGGASKTPVTSKKSAPGSSKPGKLGPRK